MSLFRGEKLVSCQVVTPVITGVTDASTATAGSVGEVISALVAVGSPVSLTTATAKTVASITLTPGDWDVRANLNLIGTSATTAAGGAFSAGISSTTNTLPTDGSEVQAALPAVTTTSFKAGIGVPAKAFSVSASTPVYLVGLGTFSAGTLGGYGVITARRRR